MNRYHVAAIEAEGQARRLRFASQCHNEEGNLVSAEFTAKLANDREGDARHFRAAAKIQLEVAA